MASRIKAAVLQSTRLGKDRAHQGEEHVPLSQIALGTEKIRSFVPQKRAQPLMNS